MLAIGFHSSGGAARAQGTGEGFRDDASVHNQETVGDERAAVGLDTGRRGCMGRSVNGLGSAGRFPGGADEKREQEQDKGRRIR
jgi:hypothetical protein